MRRPAKRSANKLAADSQAIVDVAQAIATASSRLEQRYWEQQLDTRIAKLLKTEHQSEIDSAMDHLFKVNLDAYDTLMEAIEAGSESTLVEHANGTQQALLIALPILAWTRHAISSGAIAPGLLTHLTVQLRAHVLADEVKLAMLPMLYSIDQLPRRHVDIYKLTERLAKAALQDNPLSAPTEPAESAPFLADTRYLLAVITAPLGQALLRWQTPHNQPSAASLKHVALTAWQTQATEHAQRLLQGCNLELMLPQAYYVACREADKQIRPASIRAADYYLTQTLGLESGDLHASIGGCGEEAQIDEYRIGFSLGQNRDIVYGIVWPLYGSEDPDQEINEPGVNTPLEDILSTLRESGIGNITVHDEHFAMEFCEDCGAPLYPDRDGELVHAEMPEDTPIASAHLH